MEARHVATSAKESKQSSWIGCFSPSNVFNKKWTPLTLLIIGVAIFLLGAFLLFLRDVEDDENSCEHRSISATGSNDVLTSTGAVTLVKPISNDEDPTRHELSHPIVDDGRKTETKSNSVATTIATSPMTATNLPSPVSLTTPIASPCDEANYTAINNTSLVSKLSESVADNVKDLVDTNIESLQKASPEVSEDDLNNNGSANNNSSSPTKPTVSSRDDTIKHTTVISAFPISKSDHPVSDETETPDDTDSASAPIGALESIGDDKIDIVSVIGLTELTTPNDLLVNNLDNCTTVDNGSPTSGPDNPAVGDLVSPIGVVESKFFQKEYPDLSDTNIVDSSPTITAITSVSLTPIINASSGDTNIHTSRHIITSNTSAASESDRSVANDATTFVNDNDTTIQKRTLASSVNEKVNTDTAAIINLPVSAVFIKPGDDNETDVGSLLSKGPRPDATTDSVPDGNALTNLSSDGTVNFASFSEVPLAVGPINLPLDEGQEACQHTIPDILLNELTKGCFQITGKEGANEEEIEEVEAIKEILFDEWMKDRDPKVSSLDIQRALDLTEKERSVIMEFIGGIDFSKNLVTGSNLYPLLLLKRFLVPPSSVDYSSLAPLLEVQQEESGITLDAATLIRDGISCTSTQSSSQDENLEAMSYTDPTAHISVSNTKKKCSLPKTGKLSLKDSLFKALNRKTPTDFNQGYPYKILVAQCAPHGVRWLTNNTLITISGQISSLISSPKKNAFDSLSLFEKAIVLMHSDIPQKRMPFLQEGVERDELWEQSFCVALSSDGRWTYFERLLLICPILYTGTKGEPKGRILNFSALREVLNSLFSVNSIVFPQRLLKKTTKGNNSSSIKIRPHFYESLWETQPQDPPPHLLLLEKKLRFVHNNLVFKQSSTTEEGTPSQRMGDVLRELKDLVEEAKHLKSASIAPEGAFSPEILVATIFAKIIASLLTSKEDSQNKNDVLALLAQEIVNMGIFENGEKVVLSALSELLKFANKKIKNNKNFPPVLSILHRCPETETLLRNFLATRKPESRI